MMYSTFPKTPFRTVNVFENETSPNATWLLVTHENDYDDLPRDYSNVGCSGTRSSSMAPPRRQRSGESLSPNNPHGTTVSPVAMKLMARRRRFRNVFAHVGQCFVRSVQLAEEEGNADRCPAASADGRRCKKRPCQIVSSDIDANEEEPQHASRSCRRRTRCGSALHPSSRAEQNAVDYEEWYILTTATHRYDIEDEMFVKELFTSLVAYNLVVQFRSEATEGEKFVYVA